MILTRPVGDTFSFSYKLDLPKELEARLLPNGSVGIFSADTILFGDVTYGGDSDYEKLQSARETAPKDHLVFAIPAPVIVQAGKKSHGASSKFTLSGDTLTVASTGLQQLNYPVSIDPSVVVTSSSEFQSGNNEGGIDFATDEIKRGSLSGGVTGSWTTSSNITTAREMHTSEAFNGFAYVIGGYTGSTALNSVEYAPINADGSLGTWQATSSFTTARYGHTSTIYNGYMYVMGGNQGADVLLDDTQYAKINADGTLGTWQTTSSLIGVRQQHASAAYNGYMYVTAGMSSASKYELNTQYAKINADGTLGPWQTTSSLLGTRAYHTTEVSNGYIYVMGGKQLSALATVEYARINADGTVGAWAATAALTAARSNHSSVIYNGYVYVVAGLSAAVTNQSTVEYAPIQSNGALGAWKAGVSITTARSNTGSFEYKGNVYVVGGYNGTARVGDTQYAKIQPAGAVGIGTATTSIPTVRVQGKDYGRYGHSTVVVDNYIYVIGGFTNAGTTAVSYASIATNGTIGTWTATTALPAARYYHASVVYGKYIYVIGGYTTAHTNAILYAQVTGAGALGAWTTNATTFTNARSSHTAVTYDNKLYILGGYGTGPVEYNDVQYATFNASGGVGTFTAATGFATGRDDHTSAVVGKYIYVIGGWNGTTNYADVQFAEINPAGGLIGGKSSCPGGGTLTGGTWCTTSSLQIARHGQTGYGLKGCLYVVGGGIAGNGLTAGAEYACSNADGTLQAWNTTTAPSAIARNNASGVVYMDNLYLLGGESSGQPAFADTYFAPINHGGDGLPQSFSLSGSFGTARYGHTAAVYNGYLYVLGGRNTTTWYNSVEYAPLNSDGTVGTWQTTTSFATARADHATAIWNGYIYVLGGCSGTPAITSNQYAAINTDGTLGNWSSTTALPQATCEHAAAAYNGYMYVMGGTDNTTNYTAVYRSTINASTKALGAWSSMSALNSARRNSPKAVVNNGYLYVVGGATPAAFEQALRVEYAKINADGTLGTWNLTTALPERRESPGVEVYNGRLYVALGNTGGGNVRTVLSAPFVGADGQLGDWVYTDTSLSPVVRLQSVFYNGRIYMVGGYNGSAPQSSVFSAVVSSISRKAEYSRLFDLGSLATVNTVSFNGTGNNTLTYRLAGANADFGQDLPAGSAGGASARYVSIRTTLEDRGDVYPESINSKSALSDMTIDYTGAATCATDQRLRHGAFFSSGAVQALDSCLQ